MRLACCTHAWQRGQAALHCRFVPQCGRHRLLSRRSPAQCWPHQRLHPPTELRATGNESFTLPVTMLSVCTVSKPKSVQCIYRCGRQGRDAHGQGAAGGAPADVLPQPHQRPIQARRCMPRLAYLPCLNVLRVCLDSTALLRRSSALVQIQDLGHLATLNQVKNAVPYMLARFAAHTCPPRAQLCTRSTPW